jgi:hypothetical protein
METTRLTTEQIEADNTFLNGLKNSLTEWQGELTFIEKELIDQAFVDARAGSRSNRYLALESREQQLRTMISNAQGKLGQVAERYNIGPLSNLLSTALNQVKP